MQENEKNEKVSVKEKWRDFSFAFRVASRYLFSKKSHNAINIISGISSAGVAVGTMALVCVLSVFNGFESLVHSLYSAFDPDLKITLVQGKNFDVNTLEFNAIRQSPSVACFTEVVEENALLRYNERQMPATIKGVSEEFRQMTNIDSIIFDGIYQLHDGGFERSVVGYGVGLTLGLSPHFIEPLRIYAPKRTARINHLRPESSINEELTFVSGIFAVQQTQYDENYVLISIDQARRLFEYDSTTVSAIELKLNEDANLEKVKQQFRTELGDEFVVKDQFEQQADFYRILQIEKWVTFLILCFIVLIASFNIIGSLSMLIIDKKEDIITLKNLGANEKQIRHIFLYEGWFISLLGALIGIVVGTVLCLLQEHFGILKMGEGSVVDAYPVITQFSDVLLVLVAVTFLGFITAYYPARYAGKTAKQSSVVSD